MKMTTTDTHVFFLSGPFSQWHQSQFETSVLPDTANLVFNCAEQFMMAAKATVFEDWDTLSQIMAIQYDGEGYFSKVPSAQKALGRSVKNFIPDVWDAVSRDFVYTGNIAKFYQNPDMLEMLLGTDDKILVEASKNDRLWGIGLAWDDPAILDPANWQGKNWLGETLMKVRSTLRARKAYENNPLDNNALWQ